MGLLNVVDEWGNVVGSETRENIHAKGLLHREIHVWFHTPKGEIIFQHRAKDKDTFPDQLDATVGGHVEIGSDFEDTAVKEVEEETGLVINKNDLKLVKYTRSNHHDPVTGKTNNAIRAVFDYKYSGNVTDLRVEKGKAEGFEAWPIEKLANISAEDAKKFIPGFLDKPHIEMYKQILVID